MISDLLSNVLVETRSGFWGEDPGTGEVDVRVVRNGDVQDDGLRWHAMPLRSVSSSEFERAALRKDDVVITTSGDCGYSAHIEAELAEPTIASNFVRILRFDPTRVDPRFAFHFIHSERFRQKLTPYIRGTTLKNLSLSTAVERIHIPLPSLVDQRRIAVVLDMAERLRAKRRAALAHIKELTEILFLDMFGDPVTNPKNWPKKQLGDVARFRQGLQVDLDKQFDEDSPCRSRFLRIINYTQNSNEFRYIAKQPESRHVQPEDVVVVRYGATAGFIGRGQYGVIANNLFTVDVHENIGTKTFVYHLLRQPRIYGLLLEGRKAAAMPAINFSGMQKLPFILPPILLQREFGRRVKVVEALKTAQQKSLSELDALFASLQHRAFRGEL